ncbi:ADP-ribosylation factor-like protein 16 [Penaeus chinensis]|uniref:ADP-ribosylation factor-like protein 16 n=1 Tax=Penaeus chinensis TaxID=139456 RepID=UPI001FB84816|nr:ADP-ribosylation factor-like protein 16 [Penaeus chinensis]XP_047485124.1 ADP-ribosylation factor-like protein 16 [Penaeus chinensis]XP_047485126.1 ADP-ribosylation factor-like protein 16 [Penaeus chinensis]XP_047485127.1 ADP-ribosylation factor-like protein 16 [Penaeus chinensis]
MLLCIGPEGTGKTLLLRRMLNLNKPDISMTTVPTVGVNIVTLQVPEMLPINIRELGGSMAPIWHNYYSGVKKLMYVVDVSNLTQLANATLLFMELLANPKLKTTQVAVVMNKTDCVLSRASNELLNAMRFDDLKEYAPQQLTTFEVSALAGKGLRPLLEWVKGTKPKPK